MQHNIAEFRMIFIAMEEFIVEKKLHVHRWLISATVWGWKSFNVMQSIILTHYHYLIICKNFKELATVKSVYQATYFICCIN